MKVILLPGNGYHDDINKYYWFPYLIEKLTLLGLRIIAKNMPDWYLARRKYWEPFIIDTLKADNNSILIGHSSGAAATMRVLEKIKVLGAILVAAHYTDLGYKEDKLSGYFDDFWKWPTIKMNAKWIVQFASKDDPFIPIEHSRFIHKKLNTEYFEFENEDHFGFSKPKTEFPEIVELIKKKIKK
ncbi:MAG: hypothetical protein UT12_C0002G0022 [Candidatus Curtissbacteria bacterium GW2011_GWC2_38_9]|uniref:Alpha/beta hydrolase n=3 Tax=Candidatus Curtissiibacteriota TaxID=1752717 RepID=A0A1F5HRL2_9BACT|nr:MAG: hypothetical protein UT12_C0002G0022 [Candidatus Curtissbacteria bacterium GW2011_GWC2_38_9]KKS03011.1 MAG: hypothetical protein UU56_C0024G0004 [Candidatus Curtissbacteria bacterium GW2011_GWA2_41_24]OGD88580.1 MAG: hypothetical protein A2Z54_01670 [Candidatus Curtissbacteria bacterium RIFCSPHIGHO2_02_39_8]OGE06723.1 MAG: hypothetical protein A2W70_04710 [Candidatus Curtissbacteria bacterium RIFCSPLOWO2_02_41_11]